MPEADSTRDARRIALGMLIAIAVIVVGLGMYLRGGGDERVGQQALHRAEHVAKTKQPLALGRLVEPSFDRLVVISGQAQAGEIRRAVGSDWGAADELAYRCCDPSPIWAFVAGRRVVAYFRPSLVMSYGDDVPTGTYRPDQRLVFTPSSANPELSSVRIVG